MLVKVRGKIYEAEVEQLRAWMNESHKPIEWFGAKDLGMLQVDFDTGPLARKLAKVLIG